MKLKYSFLLSELVKRDFKVKYKRSVLGVFWSFLNPMLMALVQYVVFGKFFGATIPFYATYLMCGISLFNYFSDALSQSVLSVVSNASLMNKVRVPSEIFPLSKILSCSINLVLSLIPVFIIAVLNGVKIRISVFLLVYSLTMQMVFMLGLAMILSSINVFFRDIQFLWGVITMIWMYATPLFYSENILSEKVLMLETFNPMYHFVKFFRTVLIYGAVPTPNAFSAIFISTLISFVVGSGIFSILKKKFVLYM